MRWAVPKGTDVSGRIVLLTIAMVLALSALRAETYMVSSTYAGDTRYAVQKLFNGQDNELCWAAAASNLIQNWQDQWVQNGGTIPAGTPNGQVTQTAYSTDVFATFVDSWTNLGGEPYIAMQWWYCGVFTYLAGASQLKPDAASGGYWTELGLNKDTIYTLTNIYNEETPVAPSLFTGLLANTIQADSLSSLVIFNHANNHAHALALWGYEMVDDMLTGLWITDSDSGVASNYLVDVSWDSTYNGWMLGETHNSDPQNFEGWLVGQMDVFSLPMVPEPSLVALILGILALGCVFLRRRHTRV